jgi:hypothetical protein
MTTEDPNQGRSGRQPDLNDLFCAHLVLVQTHQNLINAALQKSKVQPSSATLPQNLTEPVAQVSGGHGVGDSPRRLVNDNSDASLLKNAEPSNESVGADLAAGLKEGIAPQDAPTGPSDQRGMGLLLIVFAAIMVVTCILVFSPNRSTLKSIDKQFEKDRELFTSQLKQSQQQILTEQERIRKQDEELMRTQHALTETNEALVKAQQALTQANGNNAGTPIVQLAAQTPVEAKAINNEQQLAQAQQELRNIRMALVANQHELIKTLRDYRDTARTLAMNRQSIFQTGLEIRRAEGEISDEELTAQKKSWEEFLPLKVRPLMTDSRLEVAVDVLSGAAIQVEGAHGLRPEDDMPATMPETTVLINKSVAELKALMKQLTNTQADLTQTQSELTHEMGALNTSRKFLDLQAATADSKSDPISSASAETGKRSANDAPDASATKPAVKK